MAPKTRYAQCGDLNLAYQVVGDGDVDIILVPSFVSHIEFYWAHPAIKAFLDRVASFARLAIFDKAGTGLSDPVSDIPTLEQRAAEVEAVMDAAGIERPAVFGMSEGARPRSSSPSRGRAAPQPLSADEESAGGEHEEQLAQIEIGSPRSAQRASDRAAAAVARRAPGALRAAMRLDPRYRRSVRSSRRGDTLSG